MRHKIEILAGIALLAAMAGPCLAQDGISASAYRYYQLCHSVPASDLTTNPATLNCWSYTAGLFDGLSTLDQIEYYRTGRHVYLIPAKAPIGQLIMVLIKYMDDHPQELNTTTVDVALNALRKTYPPKGPR